MHNRISHVFLVLVLLVQPVVSMANMRVMSNAGAGAPTGEEMLHSSMPHSEMVMTQKSAHPGCHGDASGDQLSRCSGFCLSGSVCANCCAMAPTLMSLSFYIPVEPVHPVLRRESSSSLISQDPLKLYRPPRQS